MGIAYELYKKTLVGKSESCSAAGSDLPAFQTVVAEFDDIESQGLIDVTLRHKESTSGHNYVDLVRFTRLS